MTENDFRPEQATMLEEDDNTTKPLQPKVYEAIFTKYDGEATRIYYQAERLIEAAHLANKNVADDPFTTLCCVRELGPLNR